MIEAKKVTAYSVKPEYEGASVVPTSLMIRVSDPETYEFQIAIWGPAIDRESKVWDQVYAAREAHIFKDGTGRLMETCKS